MKRSKTNALETRKKLLDAALSLMLDQGFAATSVEEICQRAGLTKGSFFHHFSNKEELGKAVLYHFWQPVKQMLEQGAYRQIADPLERLYAHCDLIADLYEHPQAPKSCLFGNFAQELSETHPEISNISSQAFIWWADLLEADLTAAKIHVVPAAPFDPQGVAEHFVAVFEGAVILAKAHHNPQLVRHHINHFKHYLQLLFTQADDRMTR